jgi:hypothetical protein
MRIVMIPIGKASVGLLLLLASTLASKTAQADLLVSNLTSSSGGLTVPLDYGTSYAQSGAQQFITGGDAFTITQVTVLLGDSSYHGTIVAELLNQVGNANFNPPGSTVLQTFTTTQTSVADGTQVTFTPTSSFTLAANTGYWFALGTTSSSTGNLDWTVFKNPVTKTGSGSLYDQYTFGSTTLNTGGRAGGEFSLQIDGIVPEPSSAVIVTLATIAGSGYWWLRRRARALA